ncbi:MAG TPA: efflux RND transporter periplasmic adaptor subunit [Xanthomonadales bacterium]|nr:efflux RND transporter periplasmic adaptor subunit [Xanthomonadales bacterium]
MLLLPRFVSPWLTVALFVIFNSYPGAIQAQMKVRVEAVVSAPILAKLPVSGSIVSPRTSDLAVQQSGLVEAVYFEAGDRVDEGELLLELDSEMAALELQRFEAMHEESRLLFNEAERLADEARSLIDAKNISQSEYSARLANEAAAQSRVQQLELQIKAQELRIDRHKLRAPFAGVISERHAEEGEWLDANSAAFQLLQADPLRVIARVSERYYSEVKAGTPATITVDARPGQVLEARVDAVVAAAEGSSRSFRVRIEVPNPDMGLAPGMSAHLVLSLDQNNQNSVLQVVSDAIVRLPDGSAVVWVVDEGVAEPVTIALGRRNGSSVEVISDRLQEGDQVVTLGNEALRPGQAVTAEMPVTGSQ